MSGVHGDPVVQRPTASVRALAPWLAELARLLPDLARSYLPFPPVQARSRERLILAVAEVNGSRYSTWVHGGWQAFLGATDPTDADEAVIAFARACAEAGRPVDPGVLGATLPPAAVRSVRATVAQIEVASLVGNTAEGLLDRVAGRRPRAPLRAAREAVTVGLSLPFTLPVAAIGGAMRLADRWARPIPAVEVLDPTDANLLVHLLAQTLPEYLGHAVVRAAIVGLPFTVAVGIRSGRSAATVRVGRGSISVANGIRNDALLLIDGDVEPLLRAASIAMASELRSIRIRPS